MCQTTQYTFHGNIYTNGKLNPFSNKTIVLCEIEEEKSYFLAAYKSVLSAYMY